MGAHFRSLAHRLWHEHTDPHRLGLAVAVGVLLGCSPFFGLQTLLALALAMLLRLNKVAVLLGAQISIPPLAPVLGFASVQLGSLILDGRVLRLTMADFSLLRLPHLVQTFLLAWLLGGLLLGLSLAVPAYLLTMLFVQRRRALAAAAPQLAGFQMQRIPAKTWRKTVRAAIRCYHNVPRRHRGYITLKLRLDPVYRQVCEALGPAGRIVDLGTGLGTMPLLLALRQQAQHVVGIDWDKDKTASAQKVCAAFRQLEILQDDVHTWPLPPAEAMLLIDLLHYYPPAVQETLLRRVATALQPSGLLIIRETDASYRSLLTRWIEKMAVYCGWNKGPQLCFRSAREWQDLVAQLGLISEVQLSSSLLHRGNILLIARPPGSSTVPYSSDRM